MRLQDLTLGSLKMTEDNKEENFSLFIWRLAASRRVLAA